jgi:predicted CXXCH cytochrome family protein
VKHTATTWLFRLVFSMAIITAPATFAATLERVRATPHDFSSQHGGDLCVACHSSQASDPLAASASFRWSETHTAGGTRLPTNLGTWSGPTKNCLGCHSGKGRTGLWGPVGIGGVTTLDGDLRGNHPVGIPYPYNRAKNTYNGITTGDSAVASGWMPVPSGVKISMDPSRPAPNNRGIECTSCHDPHGTPHGKFLRVPLATLCPSCHAK